MLKSPTLKQGVNFIRAIEIQSREENQKAMEEINDEVAILDDDLLMQNKLLTKLNSEITKKEIEIKGEGNEKVAELKTYKLEVQKEIKELEQKKQLVMQSVPALRRHCVMNATPEKLQELLANNPHGLLVRDCSTEHYFKLYPCCFHGRIPACHSSKWRCLIS